jgi:capsule polysaccharide export protein KpsE/RkpR
MALNKRFFIFEYIQIMIFQYFTFQVSVFFFSTSVEILRTVEDPKLTSIAYVSVFNTDVGVEFF